MNRLYEENQNIFFESSEGKVFPMLNLSALYKMYISADNKEVKARILDIFRRDFGKVLVAEIMIDMNSERIIERLHSGEISKTLRHVDNYNVIVESEVEEVKANYQGDFDTAYFAKFPYGIVVEEEKFPNYKNNNCECLKIK